MPDPDDPIATLRISSARRLFGTALQVTLGVVLIVTAVELPEPSLLASALLLGFGLLVLVQALRFYRAAARSLILTRAGLYDSSGAEVAALSDIASVDRSFFAFRPSNGFLVKLKEPRPRAWVPGLWWRMGRNVGIGGATSGKAARDMADVVRIMLADPEVLARFDAE